jgi:hypothetical protein
MGPDCQRKERKEKEAGGGVGWRGEEADGPLGQKGREVSFSFFSFSNTFQIKLFFSNSIQNSSNLFTKFINFLEATEATRNHAKPNDDAQPLVVSILIKLSLIF